MADFFDVEKFPGKRGIHTWADGIIQKALVADGVAPNAVPTAFANQTGAIDRAFEVLDKIKDHVVFPIKWICIIRKFWMKLIYFKIWIFFIIQIEFNLIFCPFKRN